MVFIKICMKKWEVFQTLSINKKTLATVQDLMSEIEFYESNGMFKLADKVQKNLEKLARRVKKTDLGLPSAAVDAMIGLSFVELISRVPSCARIWNYDAGGQVVITQQHEECVAEKQNMGMSLSDAFLSCAQSALDKRKFPLENAEETQALANCLNDFREQFPSYLSQKQSEMQAAQLAPTQLGQAKIAPGERSVPKIPV